MHIYEVSIKVPDYLLKSFQSWLKVHMREMLNLGCFTEAQLFEEEEEVSREVHTLRVWYYYKKPEDIDRYMSEHAEEMRNALDEDVKAKLEFSRAILKRVLV